MMAPGGTPINYISGAVLGDGHLDEWEPRPRRPPASSALRRSSQCSCSRARSVAPRPLPRSTLEEPADKEWRGLALGRGMPGILSGKSWFFLARWEVGLPPCPPRVGYSQRPGGREVLQTPECPPGLRGNGRCMSSVGQRSALITTGFQHKHVSIFCRPIKGSNMPTLASLMVNHSPILARS